MGDNVGEDLLKIAFRVVLFILKLLPNLIRLIFRMIMGIVGMFGNKNKSSVSED